MMLTCTLKSLLDNKCYIFPNFCIMLGLGPPENDVIFNTLNMNEVVHFKATRYQQGTSKNALHCGSNVSVKYITRITSGQ